MKKILTFIPVLFLLLVLQLLSVQNLNAQAAAGTADDGFVVRVNGTEYSSGECGYGTNSGWGGSILKDACETAVWAYGTDSLCCGVIPAGSLTGKIAIIRRGTCEFGFKALNAEKAGAIGVIIMNHYTDAANTNCSAPGMGAGAVGAQVTIPVILASRTMAEAIDAAVKAGGGSVQVCFVLPRIYSPFAAYNYFQPKSQNIALENMAMRYVNRTTSTQTNVLLKADIIEPDGNIVSIDTTILQVPAGKDTFQYLPVYQPADKLGRFNVVYSTNKYNEPRDSLRRSFALTQNTFGTDNNKLLPAGVGPSNDQFAAAGFFLQNGALLLTGPDGGKATYVTLGIANLDKLVVGDPTADIISVYLYDGDPGNDGIDLGNGATASWDQLTDIVGTADFTMDLKTMKPNELFSVRLTPTGATTDTFVTLLPNHPYFISLAYDGNIAGTSIGVAFSASPDEDYLNFPTTSLYLPDAAGPHMYSGWSGASIVQRVSLQGYKPGDPIISTKVPQLAATKFSVTPNPANDLVRLNLDLTAVNSTVGVTLIDFQGRAVGSQVLRNFQNGQVTFDAAKLPSGMYSLWIRTATEGATMTKLMICH